MTFRSTAVVVLSLWDEMRGRLPGCCKQSAPSHESVALRGFMGLLPDGLDVNVQAKRTKGAEAP